MMDANQCFAELAGICWHEISFVSLSCSKCNLTLSPTENWRGNPDFSDPVEVLRAMEGLGLLEKFLSSLVHLWVTETTLMSNDSMLLWFQRKYILDTTGLLRDKAIEWMEAK
jgi:hypothetical protein